LFAAFEARQALAVKQIHFYDHKHAWKATRIPVFLALERHQSVMLTDIQMRNFLIVASLSAIPKLIYGVCIQKPVGPFPIIRAYPKIPKWHRKNPGERFN
jgi:hypothetical protein